MTFEEKLAETRDRADKMIRSYLPEERSTPGRLAEAMNYSVLAGGKRVRPVLMLQSYALYGGRDDSIIGPFAAAVEMIHTSSLVHDDLPDIDGDEYRRGRKTTHAVYGPALGILSGDALLNYAYETAMRAAEGHPAAKDGETDADGGHPEERIARVMAAMRILLRKTGIHGMLGGQSVDVENEKNGVLSIDRETLDFIYLHKTAALLEAPLMIGGVLGGAPDKDVHILEKIGRNAGLAFQIRDDVMDVTETTEEIGKPAGSDEKNGKTTYVTLLGVQGAEEEAERLTKEAVALLTGLPGDSSFLGEYLMRLAYRRS